jgi:hypothetical protein
MGGAANAIRGSKKEWRAALEITKEFFVVSLAGEFK